MRSAGRGRAACSPFALEAEVDAYVAEHLEDRDERGHRLVVRNGRAETAP